MITSRRFLASIAASTFARRSPDMARIAFDFWGLDIRAELSWLRSYLDLVEGHLGALASNPPASVRAELQHPDEDVRHPAWQVWDHLAETVAPSLSRGSYVVALYATYEAAVTELAETVVRRWTDAPLALKDIAGGDFMERARKYFEQVLRIPICLDQQQWAELRDLSRVRHIFAHCNGRLSRLNSRGRQTFETLERRGDTLEMGGTIVISESYTRRALEAVDGSLRSLIERTKDTRRRNPPVAGQTG